MSSEAPSIARTLSLKTKLLLAVGLLSLAAIAAVGLSARQSTRQEFERFRTLERSRDDDAVTVTLDRIAASLDGKCCRPGVIDAAAAGLADHRAVLVFDAGGQLIGAAGPDPEVRRVGATFFDGLLKLETHSNDPSRQGGFSVAMRGAPMKPITLSDGGRGTVHIVAWPTPEGDRSTAIFLGSVDRRLLLITTLIAVVALLLTWGVARRLISPITELRDAAKDLASGDLTRRVSEKGSDEVADLARGFNAMAAGLERQETLRRHLVNDVAHELRTPLTALRCRVETLVDGLAADPSTALLQINEEVSHLSRLVDDLEELARAEARDLKLNITEIDVTEVCLSAVRAAGLEGDPRLTLNLEAGLVALGDSVRVRQILVNLLTNADRYTPAGSMIKVTSSLEKTGAVMSVHNTGSALSPLELDQVFDRFYRADPSRQRSTGGRGLGLAIVKQLTEAQGGRVTAASDANGVTFTVVLRFPRPEATQRLDERELLRSGTPLQPGRQSF
ncbi:MAG: ATP-binding protein, partial [Vicinamibacteria bacterium]